MNENLTRSLSGLVYISILLLLTLYSKETFLCLFGLFLCWSVKEFCELVHLNKIIGVLTSLSIYFLFNFVIEVKGFIEFFLIAISISTVSYLIYWLYQKENNEFTKSQKSLILKGYIVIPFVFLTKIPLTTIGFVPQLIIGIFILIWINDTFAYIVGKSIGKNKLFERISPKKTIEGFIGGLVFSIIAGIIISKTISNYYSTIIWVFIALIVSTFGTLGDLVESKFKRIANVKDSGNVMPGHGGILDRLDSVIFVAPFLFLFFKILSYVS